MTADEAYLEESILNPGKLLSRHNGEEYANAMSADFGNKLSPSELASLIEFIKGLK